MHDPQFGKQLKIIIFWFPSLAGFLWAVGLIVFLMPSFGGISSINLKSLWAIPISEIIWLSIAPKLKTVRLKLFFFLFVFGMLVFWLWNKTGAYEISAIFLKPDDGIDLLAFTSMSLLVMIIVEFLLFNKNSLIYITIVLLFLAVISPLNLLPTIALLKWYVLMKFIALFIFPASIIFVSLAEFLFFVSDEIKSYKYKRYP